MNLFRLSSLYLILPICLSGCATSRGRFLIGAGLGSVLVGGAATALSPNSESRGMNALVFGLAGSLLGGGIGVLISDDSQVPKTESSLKLRQAKTSGPGSDSYLVPQKSDLPDFLKNRFQSAVIEELREPDSVGEDGTLHEPHKAYRITRPAELYAAPQNSSTERNTSE